MSGYLQRLVASARASRPVIRPVVGSLFSGETREGAAEALRVEENVVVRGQAELGSTPLQPTATPPSHAEPGSARREMPQIQVPRGPSRSAAGEHLPESLQTEDKPGVSGEPEYPTPVAEVRKAFEPLLTVVQEPEAKVHPRMARVQEPGANSERLERPAQPAVPAGHYTQQPGENVLRASAGGFRSGSQLAPQIAHRPGSPSRPAPSVREADEIQIHIGRIEVTAVPPPAPRPTAPPARKALNLEEYLERGRGRAS